MSFGEVQVEEREGERVSKKRREKSWEICRREAIVELIKCEEE